MVIRVGNVQKSVLFGCSEIILQDREALLAENTAENLGFPAGALKYDLGRATTFLAKNAFQFLTAGAVDQTTEFGPYMAPLHIKQGSQLVYKVYARRSVMPV